MNSFNYMRSTFSIIQISIKTVETEYLSDTTSRIFRAKEEKKKKKWATWIAPKQMLNCVQPKNLLDHQEYPNTLWVV